MVEIVEMYFRPVLDPSFAQIERKVSENMRINARKWNIIRHYHTHQLLCVL